MLGKKGIKVWRDKGGCVVGRLAELKSPCAVGPGCGSGDRDFATPRKEEASGGEMEIRLLSGYFRLQKVGMRIS